MKMYANRLPLLAVFGVLLLAGCAKKVSPPETLVGVWEAARDTSYRGASFEITETHIIFRKRDGLLDRNRLVGIKETITNDGKENYDIRYRNFSGGEQTLSVFLEFDRGQPFIRFRFQPEIRWLKASP